MLIRYKRIFDLSKVRARVKGNDARVEIKPGASPTQAKVYSLGPEMDKATRDGVRNMIADDSIKPSRSPWRAGIVFVPNGGGWRVCVDGRVLNKAVKPNSWVMPSAGDALARRDNRSRTQLDGGLETSRAKNGIHIIGNGAEPQVE